jgi:AcrR family transcriptional regulator
MTTSARERSRELFRVELAREAIDLFVAHGFDGITVEELARRLGISRATFFRYFGSKEDVLVVSTERSGADYAEALLSAETSGSPRPWELLRAAFEPAARSADGDPERLRARLRMITANPVLKARIAEKRTVQVDEVTRALASRTGDADSARIYTVAAYAVVDLTWERWAASESSSFGLALDEAFAALASA